MEQNYPTASIWRRLAALAYDSLVVLALFILVGFIIQGIYAPLHQGEPIGELPRPVVLTILFSVCFLYYSHSWRKAGQTIGMKAWRIKLVNTQPKPIQLSQCMLRTGMGLFSLLIVGLGFFWALLDKQQRSWHDMASLTRVVFIPKEME
ncbi:MAG: RDD family protein [Venatoribacter sp.]